MSSSRHRWTADLALLGNAVIWGTTFVLVKSALGAASPLLFLFLRFGVATLVLVLFYRRQLRCDSLLGGLAAGLFLFLGYFFQTTGLLYTTASKSAFFTSLSIPMVPLLGSLVYRSRPRLLELAGVVVSTVGMSLMALQGSTLRFGKGDALTFLCAIAFAAHIVAVGHFSRTSGYETIAVGQVAAAMLLCGSSFWWAETRKFELSGTLLLAVAITGLLATALAFTIQAWAQQYTSATRTALIYTLEPVFAFLTSWILTGEILPWTGFVGAALILAGVVLAELKPVQPIQHPSG